MLHGDQAFLSHERWPHETTTLQGTPPLERAHRAAQIQNETNIEGFNQPGSSQGVAGSSSTSDIMRYPWEDKHVAGPVTLTTGPHDISILKAQRC